MLLNRDGGQNLLKLFGHFSITALLLASLLDAKSFEDFKHHQVKSFVKFKDKRDDKFKKYLKQQWHSYGAYRGMPLYEKSKPKNILPANQSSFKSVGPKISVTIKKFIVEKIEPKKIVSKDINFDFYGSQLGFDIAQGLKMAKFSPQNKVGIGNFFDRVASSDYGTLLEEIKKISKDMNLNDWGIYLLVVKISNQIYPNINDSNIFSWFMFNKLGYAVKIGLTQKHIVLMHYSEKTIYSTPSYRFAKKRYYVVSSYAKGGMSSVYSYEQDYPGATKALDLSLKTLPNLNYKMKSRELKFDDAGKIYKIAFEYNQNLIDFMATYPQADYETFFNAPMDSRTYATLVRGLKEYVDGKKASDAINFVLHFVQKAFKYETDTQQFLREKVMFSTETLFYDASDCEDRAVLFSYLIKKMFGIGVVGVKYPNHMATAINVPITGDYVRLGKRKLVIADPTFVNANIGQSMPKYRSIIPQSFVLVGIGIALK